MKWEDSEAADKGSQSHHDGIETTRQSPVMKFFQSPNRTMMELKRGSSFVGFIWNDSPNRTMMELKQTKALGLKINKETPNRTMMELKR